MSIIDEKTVHLCDHDIITVHTHHGFITIAQDKKTSNVRIITNANLIGRKIDSERHDKHTITLTMKEDNK